MSRDEVQSFFERYRAAFDRLDGDAVADLWCGASGITDNLGAGGTARLTWWAADAPMRANHHALCAVYRHNGYHHADFQITAHQPMGAHHAFAHLHWTLQRADGSVLQQFHTGYQLMRGPHGPQVLLAVAHQEDLQDMKPDAAQ